MVLDVKFFHLPFPDKIVTRFKSIFAIVWQNRILSKCPWMISINSKNLGLFTEARSPSGLNSTFIRPFPSGFETKKCLFCHDFYCSCHECWSPLKECKLRRSKRKKNIFYNGTKPSSLDGAFNRNCFTSTFTLKHSRCAGVKSIEFTFSWLATWRKRFLPGVKLQGLRELRAVLVVVVVVVVMWCFYLPGHLTKTFAQQLL